MFSIPSRLYKRFGPRLLLPFLLLTLLAVLLISGLEFQSGFSKFLPPGDPAEQTWRELQSRFGSSSYTIIALDTQRPLAAETLRRVDALSARAREVPGVENVVGLTTITDLIVNQEDLAEVSLYRVDGDNELLRRRVEQTPLFSTFFIAPSGGAVFTYVVPEPDVAPMELARRLVDALDGPDVHFFGDAVMEFFVSETVYRDLIVLASIALLVVVLVESLVARSLRAGALLSVVSLVPASWTLAFFRILGQPIESTTMMVPVIVLVLATSYGIHVYRYHSLGRGDMSETLDHVTRVVLSAGFTTMVGFLSLVVTPSELLRRLGVLIIFGIAAALLTSLVLLPPLLSRIRLAEQMPRGPIWIALLSKPPRRPVLRIVGLAAIVVLAAFGIPQVRAGFSFRDTFRARTPVGRSVAYFGDHLGAIHELSVLIDTGSEYGLVDPDTFHAVVGIDEWLEARPETAIVTSYTDIVGWMSGRLAGMTAPRLPSSAAEIGEAMELLAGQSVGLSFDTLADYTWRRARVTLQFGYPGLSEQEQVGATEALLAGLSAELEARFPDAHTTISGLPVLNLRHIHYLARSQVISIVVFVPILLTFLLLMLRSLRWAALALVPTIAGVICYFGIMGWFGVLHDPLHVFMIAAMMGVSNDDVLYFVLVFRDQLRAHGYAASLWSTMHRTGMAIVQTTVVIGAGVGTMFVSSFSLLGRAAAMVTIGLFLCTAVTLFIVPVMLRPRSRAKTCIEDGT